MADEIEERGLVPVSPTSRETTAALAGTALFGLHEAHKRGWEYIALGLVDGYLKFLQKNGDLQDFPQSQYDALKRLTAAEYLRQYVISAPERRTHQEEVHANIWQRAARRVASQVNEAKDILYMDPMLKGVAEKIDRENVNAQLLPPQQLQDFQVRAQEYGKALASKNLPLPMIGISLAAEDAQKFAEKLADEFTERLKTDPQELAELLFNLASSFRRNHQK